MITLDKTGMLMISGGPNTGKDYAALCNVAWRMKDRPNNKAIFLCKPNFNLMAQIEPEHEWLKEQIDIQRYDTEVISLDGLHENIDISFKEWFKRKLDGKVKSGDVLVIYAPTQVTKTNRFGDQVTVTEYLLSHSPFNNPVINYFTSIEVDVIWINTL